MGDRNCVARTAWDPVRWSCPRKPAFCSLGALGRGSKSQRMAPYPAPCCSSAQARARSPGSLMFKKGLMLRAPILSASKSTGIAPCAARLAPSLVERAAEIGSERDRPQPEGVMLAFRGARDSQRLAVRRLDQSRDEVQREELSVAAVTMQRALRCASAQSMPASLPRAVRQNPRCCRPPPVSERTRSGRDGHWR